MPSISSIPTNISSFILTTSVNTLSYSAQMLVSGLISGFHSIRM